MFAAQAWWRRETHPASVFAACPVEQLPRRCDPCLGRSQGAFLDQGLQRLAVRNPQETSARSGGHLGRVHDISTLESSEVP